RIDDAVNTPVTRLDLRNPRSHGRGVLESQLKALDPAPGRGQLRDQPVGCVLVTVIGEGYIRAGLHERPGDRGTDAAAAPRDQCDSRVETEGHGPVLRIRLSVNRCS